MIPVNQTPGHSTEQPAATSGGVLYSAIALLELNFARLLQMLLDERGRSRAELYDFVFANGCQIDQTAMYRYFNPNPKSTRLPAGSKGQLFLDLAAAFLELSEAERAALLLIWQIQKKQRRKNGVDRIDPRPRLRQRAV